MCLKILDGLRAYKKIRAGRGWGESGTPYAMPAQPASS